MKLHFDRVMFLAWSRLLYMVEVYSISFAYQMRWRGNISIVYCDIFLIRCLLLLAMEEVFDQSNDVLVNYNVRVEDSECVSKYRMWIKNMFSAYFLLRVVSSFIFVKSWCYWLSSIYYVVRIISLFIPMMPRHECTLIL